MKKPYLSKILGTATLTIGLLGAALPAAAVTLPPLVPECARQGTSVPSLNCALQAFANVANIILGLTGSAALLMFVYGGFLMLTSGGASEQIQKGKDALRNAVIGIVIILTAGTLIRYGTQRLGVTADLVIGSKCGANSVVVSLPGGEIKCVTGCPNSDINRGISERQYRCMAATQGESCIPGLCAGAADQQCCRPK